MGGAGGIYGGHPIKYLSIGGGGIKGKKLEKFKCTW